MFNVRDIKKLTKSQLFKLSIPAWKRAYIEESNEFSIISPMPCNMTGSEKGAKVYTELKHMCTVDFFSVHL